MKITSQRRNLFLSLLYGGNKITWERICCCLTLDSAPPRAPCCLRRQCAGGRRPSIMAGVPATHELWKATTGIVLVLRSTLTRHWNEVYGFALAAREEPVRSLGCLLPAAPGAHLAPNLGSLCDWKEGGEGAGCGVGLGNQQTLKWILLPILGSSATSNSGHCFSLWRQSFRNPVDWIVYSIPSTSLLLCCFQPWTSDSGNDSFFDWQWFTEITITVEK